MQDADGETALHKAMKMGHAEVAGLLAERCPEAERMRDRHGKLPREVASGAGGAACVTCGEQPNRRAR